MFGVDDIKQTRLYREISEEITAEVTAQVEDQKNLKIVKNMLRRGDSVESIAEIVEIDIEQVREISRELEQEQN